MTSKLRNIPGGASVTGHSGLETLGRPNKRPFKFDAFQELE